MSALDFLLFFVAVIFLGVSFVKRRYGYWKERGVPYIPATFPKGNLQNLGKTVHFFELAKKFYFEMKGKGKPLGGIFLTVRPVGLALDLDFVKTMLVKDFQYFHDRGFYVNERDDPLTGHLLAIEGERWKNLRSKLSPTFTSGKMKLMFPIMISTSDKLIMRLNEDLTKTNNIELGDYLSRFTIDIIGNCAFGLECNSLDNPDAEFLRMGKKAFDNSEGRAFKRLFITTFKGLSRLLRLQMTRKDISDFYTRIVKETVEYREKEDVKRDDFLNLLIQLKNKGKLDDDPGKDIGKITLNQVISNAFLFLLAGFETSSTTMKFCLLELAQNIEIQNRLRQEIRAVLERYDNQITYESLSEMKYLEQVINETLRKHPVGGVLTRTVRENYKIPKTDVVLEKGTQVFIPVLGIHHDPEIYPDPQKFDPERFSPEAIRARHPYAFLAFGEGPRNCIGMRFGMMQTKIGIICTLLNYNLSPCAKTKYPIEYVKSTGLLSPAGDCWLQVERC